VGLFITKQIELSKSILFERMQTIARNKYSTKALSFLERTFSSLCHWI